MADQENLPNNLRKFLKRESSLRHLETDGSQPSQSILLLVGNKTAHAANEAREVLNSYLTERGPEILTNRP
jgi:hypothetical protein